MRNESRPFDFLTRRHFLTQTVAVPTIGGVLLAAADSDSPLTFQATGTRVGDVSDSTAVVWTRLTAKSTRTNSSIKYVGRVAKESKDKREVTEPVEQLDGACPGASGRVRVRYGFREDLTDAQSTPWTEVNETTDFIHQFRLANLKPGTVYQYAVETETSNSLSKHGLVHGRFQTAPAVVSQDDIRFCVMTCQAYHDRDHVDGHNIYPSMLALQPNFACLTGDLVYYDSERPRAFTADLARYHWQRMFSLPRLKEFNRQVATYWLKDDHDTLDDDSFPGESMGDFKFAVGQAIF
ncbi:MAG: hypothetical protein FJ267_13185, partial [Planctomycetes bacterium]|nr:hypothetical protein [Planctomycetota bacterium]